MSVCSEEREVVFVIFLGHLAHQKKSDDKSCGSQVVITMISAWVFMCTNLLILYLPLLTNMRR